MRRFEKESRQASDALSDSQKVRVRKPRTQLPLSHSSQAARNVRRQQRRLQQQQKQRPLILNAKSAAPVQNFAPPPHMCNNVEGKVLSSISLECSSIAQDDVAGGPTDHQTAEQETFHHISTHALHSIPAAELLPRVSRCRFVSEFFPHLRGMYSSEDSEEDSPNCQIPAVVTVKQKSAVAPSSAAEARELTPAEKLKRRMMLALAKTRQRDLQTSNVKAVAVAEEQRKTCAVREQMREKEARHPFSFFTCSPYNFHAQADIRVEQRHKRRSNERRDSSRSSSPDDRGRFAASAAHAERQHSAHTQDSSRSADDYVGSNLRELLQKPFDAEAYLEATTFGVSGGLSHGNEYIVFPATSGILFFLFCNNFISFGFFHLHS